MFTENYRRESVTFDPAGGTMEEGRFEAVPGPTSSVGGAVGRDGSREPRDR